VAAGARTTSSTRLLRPVPLPWPVMGCRSPQRTLRPSWPYSTSAAANVVGQRTRLINQLHALLRDLVPGGAPADLTVAAARRVLLRVAVQHERWRQARAPTPQPPLTGLVSMHFLHHDPDWQIHGANRYDECAGPVESIRKQIAGDLIAEVANCDARLAALTKQIAAALEQTGSRLVAVDGVGPVVAARLLGRTGNASRFRSAAAFAMHAGVAPIEVASAEKSRHRLPRGGDRQLNYALHIVALTQVRMRASRGRAYYESKIAQGKTRNEAMRCLKRCLADHVWRVMVADERQAAGPGGHSGAAPNSSAADPTPPVNSSEKSLPGPTGSEPTAA